MQGVILDKWEQQTYWSVLLAGAPKGAGKTTIALSAPTPLVVLACDLGRLSIPSGVDRSQVLILPYHDLTRLMQDTGNSAPQRNIYTRAMREMTAIYKAVKNHETLKLEDGTTFPAPKTVVLDGFSRLNTMLVDGKCAASGLLYVDDLPKESRFKFWGTRLADVLTIVQQFASLPCNVIITAWIDAQKNTDGSPTGMWLPDIGGKMDLFTSGVVSASLHCFSRQGRYYVQTKGTPAYPWCGIRDKYGLPEEIDVTIEANKPLPFERIFGSK